MAQYDYDTNHTASLAVVEAVSTVADCDPTALPPLYDTIDPDALDALFSEQTAADVRPEVSFTYNQYDVTITQTETKLSVELTQ
ncbi:hypothetical protein C482_00790 [Natrialba chahannaoensis JCM 10990]|uniref:Halobacterial output domain-containing protein n=1 Tax=Natrialba chahannaoensis JCM 10990 TaxID=1227492 RepID=M0B9G9_9EURY|nr:HalOD1 output domain-containing protein [Natrialba chahannaoensis]ELZ06314.1 hypothetical protein C482_00790 [Natrialba chahannaoensis JCM 10990]